MRGIPQTNKTRLEPRGHLPGCRLAGLGSVAARARPGAWPIHARVASGSARPPRAPAAVDSLDETAGGASSLLAVSWSSSASQRMPGRLHKRNRRDMVSWCTRWCKHFTPAITASLTSAPSVPGHRHPPAANKVEDKRLLATAEPRPVGPPGVPKWVFGGVLALAHALPFVYLQLSRRPPFHPRPALLPASLRSIRRVDFAAAPRVRFSPCAVARCRRPPLTVPPIGDLAETAGA